MPHRLTRSYEGKRHLAIAQRNVVGKRRLARNARRKRGGIEKTDATHPGPSLEEPLGKPLDARTKRTHDPHSRHHHAMRLHDRLQWLLAQKPSRLLSVWCR